MDKMKAVLQNETWIAFSTDGRDGNDVEKSSIYDFLSILCHETLFIKKKSTTDDENDDDDAAATDDANDDEN